MSHRKTISVKRPSARAAGTSGLAESSLDPSWLRPDIYNAVEMAIVRTILAMLIALSVAMLPATGGAAFTLKAQDSAEMSAAEPMHDCCPPKANPCDKTADDCGSMAACAMKCFGYTGSISPLMYLPAHADAVSLFDSNGLRSQTGSPPFRPPRA